MLGNKIVCDPMNANEPCTHFSAVKKLTFRQRDISLMLQEVQKTLLYFQKFQILSHLSQQSDLKLRNGSPENAMIFYLKAPM